MSTEILKGMARAFFATAWAEQHEEAWEAARNAGRVNDFNREHGSLSGCDIMDVMPTEIDPAALKAAEDLERDMIRANDVASVTELYLRHDGGLTPETWGHYAAMQAMGHGVGLWEYGIEDNDVRVPFVEFDSLEGTYFPVPVDPCPG